MFGGVQVAIPSVCIFSSAVSISINASRSRIIHCRLLINLDVLSMGQNAGRNAGVATRSINESAAGAVFSHGFIDQRAKFAACERNVFARGIAAITRDRQIRSSAGWRRDKISGT